LGRIVSGRRRLSFPKQWRKILRAIWSNTYTDGDANSNSHGNTNSNTYFDAETFTDAETGANA
jgi:hypothetical protein